ADDAHDAAEPAEEHRPRAAPREELPRADQLLLIDPHARAGAPHESHPALRADTVARDAADDPPDRGAGDRPPDRERPPRRERRGRDEDRPRAPGNPAPRAAPRQG